MKQVLLLLLALGAPAWGLLTHVHERNVAVAAGAQAYERGNAPQAATAFATALSANAQQIPDPRLLLNLAHAQVRAGQLAPAQVSYGRLLTGSSAQLGSVARQQLAVLAAQRGEIAQALNLLRQALLLDPTNSGARFNYELLSDYLARRPKAPKIGPPPEAKSPKPAPDKNGPDKNQPAEKAGTDRQGQVNTPQPAPPPPNTPPERRPDPNGQADKRKAGGAPGAGTPQPLNSGQAPGNQRGLDASSASPAPAPAGRSSRPGSDAATPADLNLQTQRERLEAMNLSPAQARQLLETLRAQEQQYLQQLTRPAQQKPDPSKPTW